MFAGGKMDRLPGDGLLVDDSDSDWMGVVLEAVLILTGATWHIVP